MFFDLMLSCGARPSTLVKLTYRQIKKHVVDTTKKNTLIYDLPEDESITVREYEERQIDKNKKTFLYLADCESDKGDTGFYGDIVPNEVGQSVLIQLLEYQELFNIPLDDFIFEYKGVAYSDAFSRLVKRCKLDYAHTKRHRTLYALRHFYITYSLEYGIPTSLVANNSFTSIEMIEKHYSHVKSKSNIEQLATII